MSRRFLFCFCFIYAAVLAVFSVLIFTLPRPEISETENRALAHLPSPTAEGLLDGSFMRDFSSFCSDRFPMRNSFLSLNSASELALGKLEADGVMLGADGNLIKRVEYSDTSQIESNLAAIERIKSYAEARGVRSVFFCAPRGVDVLSSSCPILFDSKICTSVWELAEGASNINEELEKRASEGEYVFYKTDHHWTALGAYYAYAALGRELGYTPLEKNELRAEKVSENFFGTTYSSTLFPFATPDTVIALRYEGDTDVKVTDVSTQKLSGMYNYASLDGSSKYDFFLGGNKAHLRVESGGKPRLVVVKDSFANCLVPLLSAHYDIDVIDPRYIREPLDKLLDRIFSSENPTALLLVFGLDTLSGDAGLEKFP